MCLQPRQEGVKHGCAGPEGSKATAGGGDFVLLAFKTLSPACFHVMPTSPTQFLYIWRNKKQQKSGSALSLPLPRWVSFSQGQLNTSSSPG